MMLLLRLASIIMNAKQLTNVVCFVFCFFQCPLIGGAYSAMVIIIGSGLCNLNLNPE